MGTSRASTIPAGSPRPGIFSRAGAGSKPPRWGCRSRGQLLLPVAPCVEVGGCGLATGTLLPPTVPAARGHIPTGLPRLQAPDSRLSSLSLQRFFLKALNCLEKDTCELHLFSLRVNNSVYSVIFRNLYNYCIRHAANYMYCRSEMRVIGRIGVPCILGRIFYFHTVPQSDIIHVRLERNPLREYGRH